jgi:predicted O-methyltransferase YrrM
MLNDRLVTRAQAARSLPKRALVRGAKSTLRRSSRGKPVPLETLLRLRRFGGRTNMLTFKAAGVVRPGTALENPFLAARLGDRRFGDWTISAQAMNFLEREIRARPPHRVLEFGSGLSTACLARYMAEASPGVPAPALISVEENDAFCTESRALLADLGLDEVASIQHGPVVAKEVAGRAVHSYDVPRTVLAELEAGPADLVFIDGPGKAGGAFGRWAVLHTALALLQNGFRFYLDDALTDSALQAARLWRDIAGVRIDGVALVGHGVLVGEYRPLGAAG